MAASSSILRGQYGGDVCEVCGVKPCMHCGDFVASSHQYSAYRVITVSSYPAFPTERRPTFHARVPAAIRFSCGEMKTKTSRCPNPRVI
ncbi:hypothetical protein MTO96_032163 [Rhipicephalus appendiculatus]